MGGVPRTGNAAMLDRLDHCWRTRMGADEDDGRPVDAMVDDRLGQPTERRDGHLWLRQLPFSTTVTGVAGRCPAASTGLDMRRRATPM